MRSFQTSKSHFKEPQTHSQNPLKFHRHQTHPTSFCVTVSVLLLTRLTPFLPWETQGAVPTTAWTSWISTTPSPPRPLILPRSLPRSPAPPQVVLFPKEEPTVMLKSEVQLTQEGEFSPGLRQLLVKFLLTCYWHCVCTLCARLSTKKEIKK